MTTTVEHELIPNLKQELKNLSIFGLPVAPPAKAVAIDNIPVTAEEDEAFAAIPSNTLDIAPLLEQNLTLKKYQNPLVIYHGKCADGFSAAWVFHHVGPFIETSFDFHAGVYGEDPPDVEGRIVYMVDFSYKRDVVKKMLTQGKAKSIIVIDHHKTAFEELATLSEELEEEWHIAKMELGNDLPGLEYQSPFEFLFNIEMSGATLAWDYWRDVWQEEGISRPVLLGHVEDRDLWRFKLPLTREIQANVVSYEYTFENWDKLMLHTNTLQLAAGGEAIERKHHKDIAGLVKVCKRFMFIGGYHVPVASLPYTLTSDAGHLMAKEHLEGKAFAACYWDTAEHRIFSLRSTENGMDVSAIAKEYGGGGHKNAAGFKVSRAHPLAQD